MVSLYERTCEIKQATGWSQERIGAETGLGLSTISRILRIPGYGGNATSKALLVNLHEEVVNSPFPIYLEKLFNRYDLWRENKTKKEFSDLLETLQGLVSNHQALETDSLEACRLHWLLGHLSFDRAFYLKFDAVRAAAKAIDAYQAALDILSRQKSKNVLVQQYKLQQCIVSTQFNSCQSGQRHENDNVRQWLTDMDYLDSVKQVIKQDTWNWIAARNGLVAASILQNEHYALYFWEKMQNMNSYFIDPDFAPSNDLPSISQDPDLTWFMDNVLKA
jgi:transcriptional regulator with XRE-family HTH domain